MLNALVLQSDFGKCDGAVSAMYGVAYTVCRDLNVSDLTHEIPQYDIWEASHRLIQAEPYWPSGTVFVSVVDPGVGTDRKSIVVRTNDDKYIVTPDNGTITLIKNLIGIKEARIIDESKNRLPHSNDSYTFHGRDVYVYTGARLASGEITFEEVGGVYPVDQLVSLNVVPATLDENGVVRGTIDVLDVRFGSLWSNIDKPLFDKIGVNYGEKLEVAIENDTRLVYKNVLQFVHSFNEVYLGESLVYINSLNCLAVAINQGSFAKAYNIGTGTSWKISFRKAPKVIYE